MINRALNNYSRPYLSASLSLISDKLRAGEFPMAASNWTSDSHSNSILDASLAAFMMQWVVGASWASGPILLANVSVSLAACMTTICVMPRTSVKATPKIFYVAIAFSALPPILVNSLFIYLLKTDLPLVTGGRVHFSIDSVSLFSCQFSRFCEQSSSSTGAYTTLFFAAQRLTVIALPFKSHLFTARRTACGVLLIVVYSAALNSLAFVVYGPNKADSVDAACAPVSGQESVLLGGNVMNYMVPNALLLLVTILVTAALRRHRRQVARPGRRRGVRTTVILVCIAACRCGVYLPWASLYIISLFTNDTFAAFALRIMANVFFILCDLLSIFDFCLYCKCIPDFRSRLAICKFAAVQRGP